MLLSGSFLPGFRAIVFFYLFERRVVSLYSNAANFALIGELPLPTRVLIKETKAMLFFKLIR